nr:zf-HC2 domain-containing protein [Anaerobacterium chartisolvens]
MNCNLDKSLLQDLLEGIIDPIEKIVVEEHLKCCSECRRELSELKLLLWDLNNKDNYEVEFPDELDDIKEAILGKVVSNGGKSAAGAVVEAQKRTLASSVAFVKYIPGAKGGGRLIKKGGRAASAVVWKASKSFVKGVGKIIAK